MLWMMPAWVAWCWSGTGDDQHQDDLVDLSQDDLVDDGRVGGVVQVMTCIRMIVDAHRQGGDDLHQDDDADKVVLVRTTMWWMTAPRMTWWTTASSGGWLADLPRARVVRRRAHQVLTGFRICRARVGGPPPGPKTTEGMR